MTLCTDDTKIAEVRISKVKIWLGAVVVGVIVTLCCLHIADTLDYSNEQLSGWDYPLMIVCLIPLIVIHELIHGLAAIVFGGLRWSDIQFTGNWRLLAVGCHPKVPISVNAVRKVGIAPLIITVPIAFALLLLFPNRVTALVASVALVGCIADVWMLWDLRRFDGDMLYCDHPSEAGFEIHAPEKATDGDSGQQ